MPATLRTIRRRVATAVAVTAIGAAAAIAVPNNPVTGIGGAQAAAVCDSASGSVKQFYQGQDASNTYNRLFSGSTKVDKYLNDYVPQGVAVWPNWDGSGQRVYLIGMHHKNEEKYAGDANQPAGLIYAVDTAGYLKGVAYLPHGAHAGSVRVYGKWMYVQQNTSVLRRYSLKSVRLTFRLRRGIHSLGNGTAIKVTGASFFDIFAGKLYAGEFHSDQRGVMRRYTIGKKGGLSRDGWGPLQVPLKAQGLTVTKNRYIFSTSYKRGNRGNIYVIKRGYSRDENFEKAGYRCFRAPVLTEDITEYKGTLYLLNESGASYFADGRKNKITHLHKTTTAKLTALALH
ncbi:hypothetical protein FOE78_06535 [Microlunatus elymi]|uniref:Uncharacterized protein n=1 Tax=Microlunatus elymi TaxID=2596828 RepID=A0A516PWP1_9ACTN|nr:hypothetical protein [Microlunatus elymi]QDP95607.1 hypothetical protein FOE78_06535 [Microlunatus elymi]